MNHQEKSARDPVEKERIERILKESRSIAIVGLSNREGRPSLDVGRYLKRVGYTIYPVHPNISSWEGGRVWRSLREIDEPIDIVNIFRKAEALDQLIDEIIEVKPKTLWTQLGIANADAAEKARRAGIEVIEDRCLKIERIAIFGAIEENS